MRGLGYKIAKVLSVDASSLSVELQFSDGLRGRISLRHIFGRARGLAAEILRGEMFDKCFVESGALAWSNGFELCPDALRQWIVAQRNQGRKKAA